MLQCFWFFGVQHVLELAFSDPDWVEGRWEGFNLNDLTQVN